MLWLDNDADVLEPYADALNESGILVDLEADPSRALEELTTEDSPYDCLLLDLRFYALRDLQSLREGQIRNGFEFLRRIDEAQIGVSVGILSSYLQLEEYEHQLEDFQSNRNIRGALIDKYIDAIDTELFQINFIGKISSFVEDARKNRLQRGLQNFEDSAKRASDPFRIGYDNYLRLSKDSQSAMRKSARERVSEQLKDLEEGGVVWALYLVSSTKPFAIAKDLDEIWSKEKVAHLAREKRKVPYQFRTTVQSDDAWNLCQGSRSHRSYPKIVLQEPREEGGGSARSIEWAVHFDTGSFESFFSLEEFLDIGMYGDYADMIDVKFRGKYFSYRTEEVCFSVADTEGDKIMVTAKLNLVEGWGGSPFRAKCSTSCTDGYEMSNGFRNCINRTGLIGRSILSDNSLSALVSGSNPVVKVRKES